MNFLKAGVVSVCHTFFSPIDSDLEVSVENAIKIAIKKYRKVLFYNISPFVLHNESKTLDTTFDGF